MYIYKIDINIHTRKVICNKSAKNKGSRLIKKNPLKTNF